MSTPSPINYAQLIKIVNNATASATTQISGLGNSGSAVSIGKMFQMQMTMNTLSQLCEMVTNVISSSNSAIQSMARNVK